MSTPTANWSYPTPIRFGAGRIKGKKLKVGLPR